LADNARLSVETVTWRVRVIAVFVALVLGTIAFAPIFAVTGMVWLLIQYLTNGDPTLLVQIQLLPAILYGGPLLAILGLFIVPDLAAAVLICWGIPGLVLTHAGLRLRLRFCGFLLLGAANGVLGWVLFRIATVAADNPYGAADQFAEQLGGILHTSWIMGPTGAVAASVAWAVMRVYARPQEPGRSDSYHPT
jgi:hypothetical protein